MSDSSCYTGIFGLYTGRCSKHVSTKEYFLHTSIMVDPIMIAWLQPSSQDIHIPGNLARTCKSVASCDDDTPSNKCAPASFVA